MRERGEVLNECAELLVVETFGERGVADQIHEADGGHDRPRAPRIAPRELAPDRGAQLESMDMVDETSDELEVETFADQLGEVLVGEAGAAGLVDRTGDVIALGVRDSRQ